MWGGGGGGGVTSFRSAHSKAQVLPVVKERLLARPIFTGPCYERLASFGFGMEQEIKTSAPGGSTGPA